MSALRFTIVAMSFWLSLFAAGDGRAQNADRAGLARLAGTWTGAYDCVQGRTGVTLTIWVDEATGRAGGLFELYALPDNPGVPSGRFQVRAVYKEAEGRLRLDPAIWEQRPEGYEMVGFDGYVDLAAGRYEGEVAFNGCGAFSLTKENASAPGAGNAQAQAPDYDRLIGVWKGRYRCGQGLTGVTVTLHDKAADGPSGIFEFYPIPENPDIPSGSYTVHAAYDPATGALRLEPLRWISMPPGYELAAFDGVVESRGAEYRGRVEHPACADFSLTRVEGRGEARKPEAEDDATGRRPSKIDRDGGESLSTRPR
jgi:hypothetical protein